MLIRPTSPIHDRSDEMLTKELALKKDGDTELRDAQRQLAADTDRAEAALRKINQLQEREP